MHISASITAQGLSWNCIKSKFNCHIVAGPDPSLAKLDAGEHDATTLASELHAEQLIVDDWEGRREAERSGIPAIGTLGVLREAASLKLLDIPQSAERIDTVEVCGSSPHGP